MFSSSQDLLKYASTNIEKMMVLGMAMSNTPAIPAFLVAASVYKYSKSTKSCAMTIHYTFIPGENEVVSQQDSIGATTKINRAFVSNLYRIQYNEKVIEQKMKAGKKKYFKSLTSRGRKPPKDLFDPIVNSIYEGFFVNAPELTKSVFYMYADGLFGHIQGVTDQSVRERGTGVKFRIQLQKIKNTLSDYKGLQAAATRITLSLDKLEKWAGKFEN